MTKKKPPERLPRGRPTDYTPEIALEICAQIAMGHSMRTIAKDEGMPSIVTMFAWMKKFPEFLKQYEQAKVEQSDALAEEMLDIADDGTNDWMEKLNKDGEVIGEVLNVEHVQRSRLRIDTRKWIAARMKPKKYGDKFENTVRIINGPEDLTDEELKKFIGDD